MIPAVRGQERTPRTLRAGALHLDERLVVALGRSDIGSGPFELELDLLLVLVPFVLDAELGTRRHADPFPGDLDTERLVAFEGVGQATQPGDDFAGRVDARTDSSILARALIPLRRCAPTPPLDKCRGASCRPLPA